MTTRELLQIRNAREAHRSGQRRMNLQLFGGGEPPATPPATPPAAPPATPPATPGTPPATPPATPELPKTLDELKALLQSEGDKRATQAVATAEARLKADVAAQIKAATDEATRLAGLNAAEREKALADKAAAELKAREAALAARELEIKAIDLLTAKKLPLEFKPYVLDADETKTALRIEQFSALFQQHVQATVEERLKGTGKTPQVNAAGGQTNPWLKDTFNLTKQAEILRTNPALAATLKAQAGVQ